jgi:hypothetical protein
VSQTPAVLFIATVDTARAIAVPLAFARVMGYKSKETTVPFAFGWSSVEGREIYPSGHERLFVSPGHIARQAWPPSKPPSRSKYQIWSYRLKCVWRPCTINRV